MCVYVHAYMYACVRACVRACAACVCRCTHACSFSMRPRLSGSRLSRLRLRSSDRRYLATYTSPSSFVSLREQSGRSHLASALSHLHRRPAPRAATGAKGDATADGCDAWAPVDGEYSEYPSRAPRSVPCPLGADRTYLFLSRDSSSSSRRLPKNVRGSASISFALRCSVCHTSQRCIPRARSSHIHRTRAHARTLSVFRCGMRSGRAPSLQWSSHSSESTCGGLNVRRGVPLRG